MHADPYLELKILNDFLNELPPFRRLLVLEPPPVSHLSAAREIPRLLPVHGSVSDHELDFLCPQVDMRRC